MTLKNTPYQDLLYLLRLTLRQETSKDWTFQTPLEKLFELAKFHSLEALLYAKVREIFTSETDKTILANWQTAHDKAFRRSLMFDAERQAIEKELDQAQIWHMALKGVHLRHYYPQPHLRQMSDNDILFDLAGRQKVKSIMVNRSYDIGHYDGAYDDVYYKEPFYNFEMHVKLSILPEFRPYFEDITDRLLETDQPYLKAMAAEDFYLYILAHELKHYRQGGTGLRALTDLYYYLPQVKDKLNWTSIKPILTDANCASFDQDRQDLVHKLFSSDMTDFLKQLDKPMLERYCLSGTYGTWEQLVKNHGKGWQGKVRFYLDMAFRDKTWLEYHYPIVRKHPYLRPLLFPYRLIRGLFRPSNWQKLRYILKMKS